MFIEISKITIIDTQLISILFLYFKPEIIDLLYSNSTIDSALTDQIKN